MIFEDSFVIVCNGDPFYLSIEYSYIIITMFLPIFVELLVLLALREYRLKILLTCLCANLLTRPIVFTFLYADYEITDYLEHSLFWFFWGSLFVFSGEALKISIDTACYRCIGRDKRHAVTYSVLCNLASFSFVILALCFYVMQTASKPRFL